MFSFEFSLRFGKEEPVESIAEEEPGQFPIGFSLPLERS